MTTVDEDGRDVISVAEIDALAVELLDDLRTRSGGPHIEHARRVAAGVTDLADDRVIAAALLHDVVEKGRIGLDGLRDRVGDPVVVDLVDVLTHRTDESDVDYLARCVTDPRALAIKRLDLADKLVADDHDVPARVLAAIRRQATERLAVLDRLVGRAGE